MSSFRCVAFLLIITCALTAGCQSSPSGGARVVEGVAVDPDGVYRLGEASEIRRREAADERVRSLLRKTVPVAPETIQIVAAIDDIRKRTGADIIVNWTAIEQAGIEKDLPVTIDKKGYMTADEALRLIVERMTYDTSLEPLAVVVRDGAVQISTRRDLDRWTEVRVYDVRPFLDPLPNTPRSMGFRDGDMTIHLYMPDSPAATTLFADWYDDERPTRDELVEYLSSLIMDTVGSISEWAAYGGEVSAIHEFEGDLIVRTTPENHRQLAYLFAALRASRAEARRKYEEQLKTLNKAGIPDLVETLRRIEKRYEDYTQKLDQERERLKAGQPKPPEPGLN